MAKEETAAIDGRRLYVTAQEIRICPSLGPHVRRANSRPRATGAREQLQGHPWSAAVTAGLLLELEVAGTSQRIVPQMAMTTASIAASNFDAMGETLCKESNNLHARACADWRDFGRSVQLI